MEFIDVPEGKNIKKQSAVVDFLSFIVDKHASPVGLACNRAIGLEQIRIKIFLGGNVLIGRKRS